MTAAETWPGHLALPAPAGSPEGKKKQPAKGLKRDLVESWEEN
jgi:hypothetical protein